MDQETDDRGSQVYSDIQTTSTSLECLKSSRVSRPPDERERERDMTEAGGSVLRENETTRQEESSEPSLPVCLCLRKPLSLSLPSSCCLCANVDGTSTHTQTACLVAACMEERGSSVVVSSLASSPAYLSPASVQSSHTSAEAVPTRTRVSSVSHTHTVVCPSVHSCLSLCTSIEALMRTSLCFPRESEGLDPRLSRSCSCCYRCCCCRAASSLVLGIESLMLGSKR